MHGNLFRKAALDHQKESLLGDVLVKPPLKLSIIACAIAAWCGLAVAWLLSSSYAQKQTVTGWLEPSHGLIRVFAEREGGKVKQLLVSEGDRVAEGQPLMVINGDRILSNGVHLEQELLAQYRQQQSMLNKQIQRIGQIYQVKEQDLHNQVAATQLDLSQIEEQLLLYQQREALLQERNNEYKKMRESGHLARLEFDTALQESLSLRADLKEIKRLQVRQENNLHQLQSQLLLLPDEQQTELTSIKSQLSDIALQMAQIHGQRAYVIKATQPGIVSNIQISQGQYTRANLPLLTITPNEAYLLAKVIVPVRAAGFVEPQQKLDIRFDAFPYQKFGLYGGTIESVADTVLLPNEFKFLPLEIREPVYLVTARLDEAAVLAYGKEIMLRSGMTFSADVVISQRSLMEWLLEPIYSIKGKL